MNEDEIREMRNMERRQRAEQEASAMDAEGMPYNNGFFEYFKNLISPDIPESMRNEMWGPASKVHSVTFLDKRDQKVLDLKFDVITTKKIASLPPYEHTYELGAELGQLDLWFYSSIKRSQKGEDNERRLQATQIREVHAAYGGEPRKREGVMEKIGRKLGFGSPNR